MANIDTLLTDHLDLWTSAIARKSSAGRGRSKKFSLHGIDKLRALILDLAVRGKLVPQDPKDEPASELLKRIAGWKPQAKTIMRKPDSKLPPAPPRWIQTSFGAAFALEYGSNLPDAKRSQTGEFPVFGSNGIVGSHDTSNVSGPCLVVGRKGSAGAINMCLADGCWVTDVAYYSVPPKGVDINFAHVLFQTLGLDNLGKGIKPGLNRSEAYALDIAIPPIAEQHRIVAKVDELMALCDRLEAGTHVAIEAHELLVTELMATLTASRDAGELSENWARIETHFDTLFVTEDSVDQLKQTILQLAVMGKLVPQDPKDEPASELLKRVKIQKAELVAQGKIRKSKPLSPIDSSEHPFRLPDGWSWIRFEQTVDPNFTISYGVLVPGEDQEGGVPFVRIADLSIDNPAKLPEKSISPSVDDQYERTRLQGGEILMGVVGSIGKLGVAPESWRGANIARAICRIMPDKEFSDRYLIWLLQSEFMQTGFKGDTRTLAQPTLNINLIRTALTPVPPKAEQERIVAKIEELWRLCSELSSVFSDAASNRRDLADVLVANAVR